MRLRYWLALVPGMLLGLVLVSSGVGKLFGQSAFLLEISSSGFLPPWLTGTLATWLPWGELVLGLVLIAGVFSQLAALLSAVLVAVFVFHNSWMIALGWGYQPCGCLGVLEKLFSGKLSSIGALYVDIGLLVMALVVYFAGPGKFFNLKPWYWKKGKAAEAASTLTSETIK